MHFRPRAQCLDVGLSSEAVRTDVKKGSWGRCAEEGGAS